MEKMTITFVGSGGAFTTAYGNNSALLQFDSTNLLLDCGYSTPARMGKMGIKATNIDNIWISHMHADHVGGLEEVAYKNYFQGRRTNLFVGQDISPDLEQYLSSTLKYGVTGQLAVTDYFNVIKVKKEFNIGRRTFKLEKTVHIGMMPAYMFFYDTFIFTGDSKFIDWTVRDLDGIHFIFHDTQVEKYDNDFHTNLESLFLLPKEIREKIYCMHYSEDIFKENNKIKINAHGMHIVEPYKVIILE
jgi:glyoxylase-like metal-dependent hydrolase (beta-lactamase superfamily II)